MYLPIPLDDTETNTDRALVYYTVSTKIDSDGHNVPYRTQLAVLAEILCLPSILGFTMEEIMRTYEDQLWDPANWTFRSFHYNAGTVLDAATAADGTIIWTAGSPTPPLQTYTLPT